MANKPPDGIFLWDVGLGLEQKKINIAPKTHCDYYLFDIFFKSPMHNWQKILFPIEKVQKLFGSQKYSKCQTTTHIEKNKLLLNEYLGNFRHF